jgi:hypothetical protein
LFIALLGDLLRTLFGSLLKATLLGDLLRMTLLGDLFRRTLLGDLSRITLLGDLLSSLFTTGSGLTLGLSFMKDRLELLLKALIIVLELLGVGTTWLGT